MYLINVPPNEIAIFIGKFQWFERLINKNSWLYEINFFSICW